MGLENVTLLLTPNARPEDLEMFYKDGYYYLIIAEGVGLVR